ncbi:hypothetical protein B4135_2483 [Caldibacillus debilis]|uniref:Uncharacterized protein n=1 Tax=Caldibacillus debilis TaxID=301148 RepID=A0A150LZC1_9BACI|nr:hypothetical protein B4135_2483 [Caldibacillus debilis]
MNLERVSRKEGGTPFSFSWENAHSPCCRGRRDAGFMKKIVAFWNEKTFPYNERFPFFLAE